MKKKKFSLLWRITDPHSALTDSFIFGTMHVRDARAFQLLEVVKSHILECEAFATEFNLSEAVQSVTPKTLNLPGGQRIEDLLPPGKYQKLTRAFKKLMGYDLHLVGRSQPMIIANILTERILASDMAVSLDETLWQFAKENGKILLGIETFEEQLAILQSIPVDKQLKALMASVKNLKQLRKKTLHLTEVYQSGDIYKLYKMVRKNTGSLRKILLYRRNYIMAQRMAVLFREQSTCAAIGAGHLAGQKGVLRLLKMEGYKVKPVKS